MVGVGFKFLNFFQVFNQNEGFKKLLLNPT